MCSFAARRLPECNGEPEVNEPGDAGALGQARGKVATPTREWVKRKGAPRTRHGGLESGTAWRRGAIHRARRLVHNSCVPPICMALVRERLLTTLAEVQAGASRTMLRAGAESRRNVCP